MPTVQSKLTDQAKAGLWWFKTIAQAEHDPWSHQLRWK